MEIYIYIYIFSFTAGRCLHVYISINTEVVFTTVFISPKLSLQKWPVTLHFITVLYVS